MNYRREIDGLRAIAVLPVILFHAGFALFGGGFVGVDIFFVISGYLITGIILRELERGTFSLLDFYERRARRILPMLFLVALVSVPLAWFWLLPREMLEFSHSLMALATFSSNILFWRESGYFGTHAELKPLLHTWSLAVEEQYYILFPLFLMAAWRFGQRFILVALGVIFAASLSVAEWGAHNEPTAAFYLLPTRAWELLLGAFCAFYLKDARPRPTGRWDQILSLSGLLMIACGIFVFDKTTPTPGVSLLLPTLGTVLIILCARPGTMAHELLSRRICVGIGLISYSAYLWHQPLFAYVKYRQTDTLSLLQFAWLFGLIIVLSVLSQRWIFRPWVLR